MFNYLRSDFYTLKKLKVIYIVPIVCLCFVLLSNFVAAKVNYAALGMDQIEKMMAQEDDSISDQMVSGFQVGFEMGAKSQTQPQKLPEITLKDILSGGPLKDSSCCELFAVQATGLTILMMIATFASSYFSGQIKGPYGKNILKASANRWVSYSSKIIVVCVYVAIFFVFNFLVAMFCNATMCESFKLGFSSEFFAFLGVQYLLCVAMCLITGLVAVLTNSAIGMVFAIVAGSGTLNLLFMLINLLVNKVLFKGAHFDISNYLITGNTAAVNIGTSSENLIRALIVSIAFIAIGYGVTGFINSKRDIH